jgi:hypothetical protein
MLDVLPPGSKLPSPANATGVDLQLEQPLSLAVAFAEGLSQQQLATCQALALHVDNCVEVCMQAGSKLQNGSVAAAGSDPPSGSSSPDLAALLAVEDPQTAAAIRGILLAMQALGTTLISVGAALSSEVVAPLYQLHRNMKSEQMRVKAELIMLQQHEKHAVGELEMLKEKTNESLVRDAGKNNEAHVQRQRFPFFKKSTKRKADAQSQHLVPSQKITIEEFEMRSDEAAIARLNTENEAQMFKDVLQRTELLRSDVLCRVLGKCSKTWKKASEMILWSSTSLAKERTRMKPSTEPNQNHEAELEAEAIISVAPSLPNVKSGGGIRRGSGCGATASSSRLSKLYQTKGPAECNSGNKRRPPAIDTGIQSSHDNSDKSLNVTSSNTGIQVQRSNSGFTSSSGTPMSPSAVAAFKFLGVADSDSESDIPSSDINTGEGTSTDLETTSANQLTSSPSIDVTSTDVETPSPTQLTPSEPSIGVTSCSDVETPSPTQMTCSEPSLDVDTPSPPWQATKGVPSDASVTSPAKQNARSRRNQNAGKSSICWQCTR